MTPRTTTRTSPKTKRTSRARSPRLPAVWAPPFRQRDPDGFGGFEVGFGLTRSKLDEGLNSLRGRSFFEETFFDRVYVQGYRWRWGVDVYAEGGPATFTAEYPGGGGRPAWAGAGGRRPPGPRVAWVGHGRDVPT